MSLEKFYVKISRHIALVAAYMDVPELDFIIKACRLKPTDIFNGDNLSLKLHRQWFDEYSNSLNLVKKRMNISLNDISAPFKMIATDLYAGLEVDKVASMSKLAFVFYGKHESHCIISFLGIDNFLRTFIYQDDHWEAMPPLYLGIKVLKTIAKNIDIRYFVELKQKEMIVFPCKEQRAWLTCLPPHEDFISLVKRLDIPAFEFLTKEQKING